MWVQNWRKMNWIKVTCLRITASVRISVVTSQACALTASSASSLLSTPHECINQSDNHSTSSKLTRKLFCMHADCTPLKKLFDIPVPSRGMSLTNFSLCGNYDVIYIIPAQGEFGKWHPGWGAGDRNIKKLFLQCIRYCLDWQQYITLQMRYYLGQQ